MNTIKVDSKQCKMIAHRGVSGLEKENTLAAFIAAGNRSHYGVETDVHKTGDGKFVVIHDAETGRVAGDNINVETTSFEYIRKLTLKDIDGTKGRADLRIPTLAEYIRTCKKYEKYCVLEFKSQYHYEDICEMVEIIEKEGWLDHMIFISFSFDNLVLLRKRCPKAPAQFLTGSYSEEMVQMINAANIDLDIYFSALTEENIKYLHSLGIIVNAWTVDDAAVAEKLISWGIDYITSNILE
ncbi:MAG: glycerophosphodiester phosphodiesterase family protein [Clostridia bacterium]